jgi:hypothetical protein
LKIPACRAVRAASFSIFLIAQLSAAGAAPAPASAQLTVAQLQEDLAFLKKSIDATHPDLSFSADGDALARTFAIVEKKLDKPMTRDAAWRVMATLNPVFSDAHFFVSMGEFENEMRAHLDYGGGFFPFEVHVDHHGDVFISAVAGGGKTPLARMRLERINGIPARKVVRTLLGLTHGDTPELRANVLSERWWRFYWKAFGSPAQFDLIVKTPTGTKKLQLPAARVVPSPVARANDFDYYYRFEMLPEKVALLTVNSFLWADSKRFYAFTNDAFTRIRAAGATSLMIDVRANIGGNDPMWKEGIMPYIADKPYRHGSTYVKKVIPGRESDTEKLGARVEGEIMTWHAPEPEHPLRFTGKVYVLIGRMTYSSSILFINTMQDFKFATLVGEAGAARARQSGGVQDFVLPNTKWGASVPRFILDRPSGSRHPVLVQPDLLMPDDPFDERALIKALHTRIVEGL